MAWWWPIGLLAIALPLIGCNRDNAPTVDGGKIDNKVVQEAGKENKNGKGGKDKKPAAPKADMEVEVKKLWKEIQEHDKAVLEKYTGKLIAITAKVGEVSAADWISIGDGENNEIAIGCVVSPEFVTISAYLSRNQRVVCIGKLNKNARILIDCAVVELEPTRMEFRTSEEVTLDVEKDAKVAAAKLSQWNTVVSGTVKELEHQKNADVVAILPGTAKTTIVFGVNSSGLKYVEKGQTANFRVAGITYDSADNKLYVQSMVLPPR